MSRKVIIPIGPYHPLQPSAAEEAKDRSRPELEFRIGSLPGHPLRPSAAVRRRLGNIRVYSAAPLALLAWCIPGTVRRRLGNIEFARLLLSLS